MRALPLVAPTPRTPEQRSARARALRAALGPVANWPEEARAELAERAAILAVDGVPDADRAAEELMRAELLRRAP